MAVTTEIAPDIYRISIFAPLGNLQFNHFLVKDDEPLLFHTGLRGMHAEIRATHRAEFEKARGPEAQNACHHAWLKLHR